MEQVRSVYKRLLKFDNETDCFRFVDTIFTVVAMRPPRSMEFIVKAAWFTFKVLHMFQNVCFFIQMYRSFYRTPFDMDEFMSVFYMNFIMIVAFLRGLCLAYHWDSVIALKAFINSRSCQREDSGAFELRCNVYLRINKYMIVFVFGTTANIFLWAFTTVLNAPVFKIPFLFDQLPDSCWKAVIDIAFVLVIISQCLSVWISFTQFVPILYTLRFELQIIVQQFERIYDQVTEPLQFYQSDYTRLPLGKQINFWTDLDTTFRSAIAHHSSFIKHSELLRKMSSLNFCILLGSAAVIISGNTFLFLLNPDIGRIPLVMLSLQYICETYLCFSMFTGLENINDKISHHVYALDWLGAMGCSNKLQQRCYQSVKQNALIVQLQINQGLPIRAGGVYPLTLETYTDLMKLVYSVLTFLTRLQNSEEI